ncbi:MAG: SpoIVB peptidase [Ruminococcus sp.]|nr:SpoIVB peptidase [Ruminococcus sp.]
MHIHIRRTAALLAAAAIQIYAAVSYYAYRLPDSYYIAAGEDLSLSSALPITAQTQKPHSRAAFSQSTTDIQSVSLELFGIIPIKDAEVQAIRTPMLIPGGQPFGIKLRMDGVMIVRLGAVAAEDGSVCPAEDAGLEPGDIIQTVNGYPITSNDILKEAFSAAEGAPVEVTFTRDGSACVTQLTPVYSLTDDSYTAGIWVRDSLAGVGTMTFYSPDTGTFGGLGHPICDADTGTCIPIGEGTACPITISSITKGVSGKPGMLQGTFLGTDPLGVLLCNNRCGVFGSLKEPFSDAEAIPMGFKQEIETGKAEILCTVSGTEPQSYTVEIEEIDFSGADSTKNMILRITDKELLQQTGGIVQGMSGSPILQKGKLIGAVTHVFVDDPTRGYGIFCENMYRFGTSGS